MKEVFGTIVNTMLSIKVLFKWRLLPEKRLVAFTLSHKLCLLSFSSHEYAGQRSKLVWTHFLNQSISYRSSITMRLNGTKHGYN